MSAPLRLVNRHTGEVLEIRRAREGDGEVFRLAGTLPPGREGPPLHAHLAEDEEGTVRAGVLSTEVDGVRGEHHPGESVLLTRGVPHRWWNDGPTPLAFDGTTRPAVDLDRYLQAMFDVLNAGPPGRPPLFYLAHVALRHRRTQAVFVMPRLLQAILFRVVVLVGRTIGKYRGDAWPGAPARCPGAPPGP